MVKKTDDQEHDLDDADFDMDTLKGDVRTSILDKFRGNNMTWSMMTEEQQHAFAREIDDFAVYIVKSAVNVVACEDMPSIDAMCGEVKRKNNGTIEAKIAIRGTDEMRHDLFDATNTRIKVIIADTSKFMGEREPEKIDPDQRTMLD